MSDLKKCQRCGNWYRRTKRKYCGTFCAAKATPSRKPRKTTATDMKNPRRWDAPEPIILPHYAVKPMDFWRIDTRTTSSGDPWRPSGKVGKALTGVLMEKCREQTEEVLRDTVRVQRLLRSNDIEGDLNEMFASRSGGPDELLYGTVRRVFAALYRMRRAA